LRVFAVSDPRAFALGYFLSAPLGRKQKPFTFQPATISLANTNIRKAPLMARQIQGETERHPNCAIAQRKQPIPSAAAAPKKQTVVSLFARFVESIWRRIDEQPTAGGKDTRHPTEYSRQLSGRL
jgi:hypothetical protein